jgi:hypothetical protein
MSVTEAPFRVPLLYSIKSGSSFACSGSGASADDQPRDFHAKCVKIPRGKRAAGDDYGDFIGENVVASTVLKGFQNRVDSRSEFSGVRPLFAEQNNQPRKLYEEIQQKNAGIHPD